MTTTPRTRTWGRAMTATAALSLVSVVALPSDPSHADTPDGCADGVETDFNGDGWPDLVVGDPTATVGGMVNAGTITVSYGISPDTIGNGEVETLSENELGSVDGSSAGDQFGFTLDTADVDCDGYTDLLVGTPFEDVQGVQNAGAVHLIPGDDGGLGAGTAAWYVASAFDLTAAAGDRFGYAVDVKEDVAQGGTPAPDGYALAIGIPGRDVGGDSDAGAVAVRVPVDGGGMTDWFSSDTPNVPGASEPGDQFGTSVAFSQFTGEVVAVDLAVGTPYEDIGSVKNAGDVTIFEDVYDGFVEAFLLDQDKPGVPGSVEAGDWFGYSLDAALVGTAGRLAVGIPQEDLGAATDAGMVQMFAGNFTSPLAPGSAISQDTSGVNDVAQAGDLFGSTVAWAPPAAGDVRSRLAVSVPGEDGSASNTGLVHVFPIYTLAADVSYTQASPGIPGAPQAGDRFGQAISVITAPGEQALVIGTPADVGYPDGLVAVIPLDGGAPRALVPDDAGASGFGASVTGDGL